MGSTVLYLSICIQFNECYLDGMAHLVLQLVEVCRVLQLLCAYDGRNDVCDDICDDDDDVSSF